MVTWQGNAEIEQSHQVSMFNQISTIANFNHCMAKEYQNSVYQYTRLVLNCSLIMVSLITPFNGFRKLL